MTWSGVCGHAACDSSVPFDEAFCCSGCARAAWEAAGPVVSAREVPSEASSLAAAREDAARLYDALVMARGFLGMAIRSPNCAAFVADEAMAAHRAIEGGQ